MKADCRNCRYARKVVEGESVVCASPGDEPQGIRWEIATSSEMECADFKAKEQGTSMPEGLVNVAGAKNTNPKDVIGSTKLYLSLVPQTAIATASLAHLNGACKYGRFNWRKCGVRASIYLDAIRRHLALYEDGEECDAEGVPHLGSAIAGLAILIDAKAAGKLNDDRPPSIGLSDLFNELTPTVSKLIEMHEGKNPRHYTIADTEEK